MFVGYPFGKKFGNFMILTQMNFFILRNVNFFWRYILFTDTKASNLYPTTHFESDDDVHFDFVDFPDDRHDTHVLPFLPHITKSNGGEP